MALTARMEGWNSRVYAILGDGEINSGPIWEGALAAGKFKTDNLKVILDYNGVQQTGTTDQVMSTEPIVDKWASFGFHVLEIHGHNMAEVLDALDRADEMHGKPVMIVARTTKGKGVSFMEMDNNWHGMAPNDEQFESAKAELEEEVARWQE